MMFASSAQSAAAFLARRERTANARPRRLAASRCTIRRKLLRAISRFDEVTAGDLFDAVGRDPETNDRFRWSQGLRRLIAIGFVRRVEVRGEHDRLVLTNEGRDALRLLARFA